MCQVCAPHSIYIIYSKMSSKTMKYSAAEYDSVCNDYMWAQLDLDDAQAIIAEQAAMLRTLKAERDAAVKRADRFEKEMVRLRVDRDDTEGMLETVLAELVDTEDKLEKVSTVKTKLKRKNKSLSAALGVSNAALAAAREENDDFLGLIGGMGEDAKTARAKRFALMDERDAARKMAADMKASYENAARVADIAEAKLNTKNGELETVVRRLETVSESLINHNRTLKRYMGGGRNL
jgi:chromosome segregation ATPase